MINRATSSSVSSFAMNDIEMRQPSFRILVVIPTLGERSKTLHRTLSSIRQQADVSIDIVVVAKTANFELSAIAAQFHAQIIIHPGHISAAVNAGFTRASEEHRYGTWLGDDDMLRPGALSNASALLEHNPAAVVVYGSCDYVDLDGKLLFERRPPPNAPALLQFIPGLIKQEACLFRTNALTQAGGLDEKLKYTMDLDILLRLYRLGSFVKSEKVLAAFCWHTNSLTIANRKASLDEAQNVQNRNARGIVRIIYLVLKYPIRYLIFAISWKINRDMQKYVNLVS